MIFLLPLIILAAAQQCPYCRWNACTLTSGSIASCSDCYLGALVNFQLYEPSAVSSITVGLCLLCPNNCYSCEYAVLSPAMSTPVPSLNCTNCAAKYVNSYFDGSCQPCPSNCDSCSCIFNNCSMTDCISCSSGYVKNGTGCIAEGEGGRRLYGGSLSSVA